MTKLDTQQSKLTGAGETIPEKQEKMRGYLALALVGLFSLVLLISLLYAVFGQLESSRVDLIKYLVSGLVGMMGVIVGFYYGQNTN